MCGLSSNAGTEIKGATIIDCQLPAIFSAECMFFSEGRSEQGNWRIVSVELDDDSLE